jgi:antitoxin ParD1/3/4
VATVAEGAGDRCWPAEYKEFAKFWQTAYGLAMSTMNISLPDSLKSFVDEQVVQRGYGTSSEYVRELIRKDQDRARLRGLLLQGAESAPGKPVDAAYFNGLRDRVHRRKTG